MPVRYPVPFAVRPDVLPRREPVVPPLVPQPDVDHRIDPVLLQDGDEVVVAAGGAEGVEGLHHF